MGQAEDLLRSVWDLYDVLNGVRGDIFLEVVSVMR